MDAARLQISGRRSGGGAARSGAGGQGGAKDMGRSIAAGKNGVGRGGDGLGACDGSEGLCRDGTTVWAAVEVCVRAHSGMPRPL